MLKPDWFQITVVVVLVAAVTASVTVIVVGTIYSLFRGLLWE